LGTLKGDREHLSGEQHPGERKAKRSPLETEKGPIWHLLRKNRGERIFGRFWPKSGSYKNPKKGSRGKRPQERGKNPPGKKNPRRGETGSFSKEGNLGAQENTSRGKDSVGEDHPPGDYMMRRARAL